MTTLILSGVSGCPLDVVCDRLREVGLSSPLVGGSGPLRDPEAWLQRLMQHQSPDLTPLHPGRAWQVAASEIFLANLDQPCWGWADTRHLRLLDFWADFEPSMRFLLILVSPAEAIGLAQIARGADVDVSSVLQAWSAETALMLGFYRRHPEITVLSDLQGWYAGLPLALHPGLQHWLGPAAQEDSRLLPIKPPNPLLVWLATQRLQAHPESLAMWDEALALVPPVEEPPPLLAAASAVAVEELARLTQWQAEAAQARARAQLLEDLLQDTQRALQAAESQRDLAQRECFELQGLLANAEVAQGLLHTEKEDTADLLEHANRALALTRLEKSELEQALAASQAAWDALSATPAPPPVTSEALLEEQQRADFLAQEKAQLLEQLHRVQAEAEHLFHESRQALAELAEAREKLSSLHDTLPLATDKATLEVTELDAATYQFAVRGAEFHGIRIETLTLQLLLGTPSARLHLPPSLQATLGQAGEWQPVVLGEWHSLDQALSERLLALSASDWTFIKAVATWALAECAPWFQAAGAEPALAALNQALIICDSFFRWDDLRLVNEQRNPDYEHLWLRFHKATCGARKWRQFDVRLGASNVRDGRFSGHFKYEFPQHPAGVPTQFERWQPELEDDFGAKFEIRFDVTKGALDAGALQSLSKKDQETFLTLMGSIARSLDALAQRGQTIGRPWADWHSIHEDARATLYNWVGLSGTP